MKLLAVVKIIWFLKQITCNSTATFSYTLSSEEFGICAGFYSEVERLHFISSSKSRFAKDSKQPRMCYLQIPNYLSD